MVFCSDDPLLATPFASPNVTVMFVLAEMQDAVRIQPHRFSQDMGQELSDELNKKFANKVAKVPS